MALTGEEVKEFIRREKEKQSNLKRLEKMQKELATLEAKADKKRADIFELVEKIKSERQ